MTKRKSADGTHAGQPEGLEELAAEVAERAADIAGWAMQRGLGAGRVPLHDGDLVWLKATAKSMRGIVELVSGSKDPKTILTRPEKYKDNVTEADIYCVLASQRLHNILNNSGAELSANELYMKFRAELLLMENRPVFSEVRLMELMVDRKPWTTAEGPKNDVRQLMALLLESKSKEHLEKIETRLNKLWREFEIGRTEWFSGECESAKKRPAFDTILRWYAAKKVSNADQMLKDTDYVAYARYLAQEWRGRFIFVDTQYLKFAWEDVIAPLVGAPPELSEVILKAYNDYHRDAKNEPFPPLSTMQGWFSYIIKDNPGPPDPPR